MIVVIHRYLGYTAAFRFGYWQIQIFSPFKDLASTEKCMPTWQKHSAPKCYCGLTPYSMFVDSVVSALTSSLWPNYSNPFTLLLSTAQRLIVLWSKVRTGRASWENTDICTGQLWTADMINMYLHLLKSYNKVLSTIYLTDQKVANRRISQLVMVYICFKHRGENKTAGAYLFTVCRRTY